MKKIQKLAVSFMMGGLATWFKKIMQRHPKVEVLEMSDLYPNKGTDKYYRSYVEVKKSNVKE